jgi:hypothetical protein
MTLPPEMAITLMDRFWCLGSGLRRGYRISEQLTLFLGRDDRVVFRNGPRIHQIDYWGYSADEARLIARLILGLAWEAEPEHRFGWLTGFDPSSYLAAGDETSGFGPRVEQAYKISDRKSLLVGTFRNGGRYRIDTSDVENLRTFILSPEAAALVARTILALIDNREHERPDKSPDHQVTSSRSSPWK